MVGLLIVSQASRVLSPLLYGVSRFDSIALGGAIAFLIVTAVIAAWLPARRAASIDPVRALQSESSRQRSALAPAAGR